MLGTWLGHSLVATLDERPDLLVFLGNFQRILYDPLRNLTLAAFDPIHQPGRMLQSARLKDITKHIWLQELDSIVRVAPIMTPSGKNAALKYVPDHWKLSPEIWRTLVDALDILRVRDLHRTEGLDAQYIPDRHDCSYSICRDLEKLNINVSSRSTGRCSIS